MKHQCSSCFGEFFDDTPSSNPPARVFCVFCGTPLPVRAEHGGVPFSAEGPREEASALGVIGAHRSSFPDTLRQFRARGGAANNDSLMPTHTEPDQSRLDAGPSSFRLRKFWLSLVIGFAVGASAAVLFGESAEPRAPATAAVLSASATEPRSLSTPPSILPGCATPPTPSSSAAAGIPSTSKPLVTPTLEKRFWLERARLAQRQYRLDEAERGYRRVLARTPQDSEALAGLGEVEVLRGLPEAAAARFREALDANDDYVPARVALADLRWQSGQSEDARRDYQHIVEHYSADLFPPYVGQRLQADACVPQCGEPTSRSPSPGGGEHRRAETFTP